MPDLEIVDAFHNVFRKNIVHIQANTSEQQAAAWYGTGCMIGFLRNPKHEPWAVIITAGHLLRGAKGHRVQWTVSRVMPGARSIRTVNFCTHAAEDPDGYGFTYYLKDPRVDIGALFAKSRCEDGQPFVEWEGEGDKQWFFPNVIGKGIGMSEGTRVAWAGFPAHANSSLGHPVLCYYEGVVSAVIDEKDHPPLYLLDGHNTWGVSGGPVWAWNEGRKRTELIGIIVNYLSCADEEVRLPGHVTAVAIHPILMYFTAKYGTAWS